MGRGQETELVISVDFDGTDHVLVLEGELDLATAPKLEAALRALVPDAEGFVLLDLERLSFIDGAGLAAIARAAQQLDGRLIVCAPRPPVRRIIELTHMDEHVQVEEQGASEVSEIADRNLAYVRQLWEVYEKGGAESVVVIADDDVRWKPLGADSSVRTPELPDFLGSSPKVRTILETMTAVGHNVLVSWRANGNTGELWTLYRFDMRRLVEAVSFDREAEAIAALRVLDRR